MPRQLLALSLLGSGCGGGVDQDAADAAPPGADAGPACGPTAGGPFWLREGETVSFVITCGTGVDLSGEDVIFPSNLPAGASWDTATRTFTWTPGLDQAVTLDLEFTVGADSGSVLIGVADAFDDPGNVSVVDPAAYSMEYGLPVMFLETSQPFVIDQYQPVDVRRGELLWTDAEAKLRGNTSLAYPKKSYTLKFTQENKFGGKRKIVLGTTFDDASYVRNRLSFAMWNRMDPANIQIAQSSMVLYLDGEYHGLYTMLDHVDGHHMEDHGLFQDGNLYKAVTADANFGLESLKFGGLKETLHQGLEKKEGLPLDGAPGAYADLDELVQFVATSSDADFAAELASRLTMTEYQDWWALVVYTFAADTTAKNAYHYHDPASGAPWRVVPWDFNESFGQTYTMARVPPGVDEEFGDENVLFARILADPILRGDLMARAHAALKGPLAAAELLPILDAMIAEVGPSARRDELKWGAARAAYAGFDHVTTFDAEAAYVRQWMVDRWELLEGRY